MSFETISYVHIAIIRNDNVDMEFLTQINDTLYKHFSFMLRFADILLFYYFLNFNLLYALGVRCTFLYHES